MWTDQSHGVKPSAGSPECITVDLPNRDGMNGPNRSRNVQEGGGGGFGPPVKQYYSSGDIRTIFVEPGKLPLQW